MRQVCSALLAATIVLAGCEKQETEAVVPAYARVHPHATVLERPIPFPRPRPDTFLVPRLPRFPRPELPLSLSRCINSYDEVVDALGSNKFQADAVILDDGTGGDIRLERSTDLPGIWYTAVPEVTGSSLFRSQLMVEWRPDPSVYFMGFTADVWSVGCVYENSATGPFTNILKGGVEILINTCFFWGAAPYQHFRVKYLVIN